eukprot:482259-Rhodomonas_salina.1
MLVWKRVYQLSPQQITELKEQLTKMIEAGIIQPSNSPYGAPVLFAPKKDGGLRLCIDYQSLNAQTVKDSFPIPHAEDLFNKLAYTKQPSAPLSVNTSGCLCLWAYATALAFSNAKSLIS